MRHLSPLRLVGLILNDRAQLRLGNTWASNEISYHNFIIHEYRGQFADISA